MSRRLDRNSKAAARARRELTLEMLRDGRRNRSCQFRSAKDYRRKPKHPPRYE